MSWDSNAGNLAGMSIASSTPSPPSTGQSSSLTDRVAARPSRSETTHDVFQTIVKGRKSWKTLRGGETVWPLELEAALLEGTLTEFQFTSFDSD